jgi:hypothetical protein
MRPPAVCSSSSHPVSIRNSMSSPPTPAKCICCLLPLDGVARDALASRAERSSLHPLVARQLPRTPKTNDGPDFRVSKAPKLNDRGDCHQDRQSRHDHVQPARRGRLPFSGRLVSLDRDSQAVHSIAGGPLRDVVCHGVTPRRAHPSQAPKL